jgi:glycosyltransferase involved in cell wall biosynthesis
MSIASELATHGEEVTLAGSGPVRHGDPYRYIALRAVPRERFEGFPSLPLFRNETAWEDATFAAGLARVYDPRDFDVTLTCAFPWTNLALRRRKKGRRPPHVFVTQNGDWPAYSNRAEYRLFGCDGLVCTNPDYYERNRARYNCALIPNGVDLNHFTPGRPVCDMFDLPTDRPIVLMVSALIDSKNIPQAIKAVALLPSACLVVAGDGPLRDQMQRLADEMIPGRYKRLVVPADLMPNLYRSADAFLHLSRDESFGNVFVEALACGTPVVAYDLPRTRWILGDTGFLSQDESSRGVASQLERAITTGREQEAQFVRRAAGFGWPAIAQQYRAFLQDVTQAAAARS